MVFDQLKEVKERGESYPEGFTKRVILISISQNFPEGTKEPVLRNFLDEALNITDNSGIKNHLSDLNKNNCLTKESKPGFANVWKMSGEYESFKSVVKIIFEQEEFKTDFMKSDYVKQMIDLDFVNYFAPKWWREFAKSHNIIHESMVDEESGEVEKSHEDLDSEELLFHFDHKLLGLEKKELVKLLKISPGCLETLLFPKKRAQNLPVGSSLHSIFLIQFIRDAQIYGIPEGKGLEGNIKVKYGDYTSGKNGSNVFPSIETEAKFGVYSGEGEGENEDDSSE